MTMNDSYKSKRGQLFSLDAIASLVIFISIIIFTMALWNLYSTRLQQNMLSEELQLTAFQVSDILLQTSGVPSNWEDQPEAVQMPGLAETAPHLVSKKIDSFLALDYNAAKKAFNLEAFEYTFTLLDANGNKIKSSGMSANATKVPVISLHRWAVVDNETRQIIFSLWTK